MKLNYRQTVFVGMSFMALCAFWQLYDQVVPMMLGRSFGFGDTGSGAIMALDNIVAFFMLPFFGILSDNTRTRLGKRMPYIIAGTLLAALMTVLLPFAEYRRNLPMFMGVLVVLIFAMAIYRTPAVALMPDVTAKPLRPVGNAVINLVGSLGGVVALGLIWLMVPDDPAADFNYVPVFAVMAGIMVLSVIIMLVTVRENKLVREMNDIHYGVDPFTEDAAIVDNQGRERLTPALRKDLLLLLASVALWYMGYNAVTSAYSRYALAVWDQSLGISSMGLVVANAGAIFAFIPVGLLAPRVGRKRLIRIGIVILALCFGSLTFFTDFVPAMYAIFVVIGIGWACINVCSFTMVVDLSRGASIGRFTGYYYMASMAAQVITPIVSGHLLQTVGYWTLFPYAAVMIFLAFITMGFVKLRDSKPRAL